MAVEDKFADEVMSDAELELVAGGGTRQTVGDGKFLTFQRENSPASIGGGMNRALTILPSKV